MSRDHFPLSVSDLIIFLGIDYLQHGGDVNAADNVQQTPLHWAAVKGSVEVADLMLQRGARIEAADVNGYRVKIIFFF